MESEMKKLDGLQALAWTKEISRIMRVWPLVPNYYLFYFHVLCFSYAIILQVIDLYESINDVDKLIDNFTENLASTIVYVRIVMLRVHNYQTGKLLSQVIEDYNASVFKNSYEIKVFMKYVNKGRFMLKRLSIFIVSSEFFYSLDPLLSSLSDGHPVDENNQTVFIMLYTIYCLWEVNISTRYYLTYLPLGFLAFYMVFGGSTVDYILISLAFSIKNGKLTVLTVRINALYGGLDCRKKLNKIIAEHSRLLKARLLLYLVNIQFLICVIGYQVLICYMAGRESESIKNILSILQMYLILIIIYCVISEYLTEESPNCCKAFSEYSWCTLTIDSGKDFLYCIKRSQKLLGLDAGKFTTYSLIALTVVTQTAVGHLSALKNFLIRERISPSIRILY